MLGVGYAFDYYLHCSYYGSPLVQAAAAAVVVVAGVALPTVESQAYCVMQTLSETVVVYGCGFYLHYSYYLSFQAYVVVVVAVVVLPFAESQAYCVMQMPLARVVAYDCDYYLHYSYY